MYPDSGFTCKQPKISSQKIIGPDSAYYRLIHSADSNIVSIDSEVILFLPDSARNYSSTLQITLDNGQILTAHLGGGEASPDTLVLRADSIQTDTIGDLTLALKANTIAPSAFDVELQYDSSILAFHGAFDDNGDRIDTEIGGAMYLRIPAQTTFAVDSIIASLHFDFYPTTQNCALVTFGPAHFLDTTSCSVIAGTTAQICGSGSCEQSILSGTLRNGTIPPFSITPNPASSVAEITASIPVPSAKIELLNALGAVEFETIANLGPAPYSLDLTALPSGLKFVRISTANGARTEPVVLTR